MQYIAVHYMLLYYIYEFSKTEIIEMQNEFFEKMTEAGKSSFATMQAFGEINTKVLKELSELQISLASYSIESGVELTKTLSSTKDYNGFLSTEAEFASAYGNKMMEYGRKAADVITGSRDEFVGLFEKTMESATVAEKKPATKRNTKKAA